MSASGETTVRRNVLLAIKTHRLTKELLQNEMRQLIHLEAAKKLEQTWGL